MAVQGREKKTYNGTRIPLLLVLFLLVVISERLLGVYYLEGFLPGLDLMTFLTAFNLLLFALALLLKTYHYIYAAQWTARVGLLFVGLNFFDWSDYGSLFAAPSSGTTWMLLLLGCSILVEQLGAGRYFSYSSELLSGGAVALAVTSFLGLLAGRERLGDFGPFVTTSFFTSLSVFLLGLTTIRMTRDGAAFALYKDKGIAGRFVRRLLVLVVGVMTLVSILASPTLGPTVFTSSSDLLLIFSLLLSLMLFVVFSLGEMFRREVSHAQSAEQDAERSNRYLAKTLEIAPVGVMVVDHLGRIVMANPAACQIHGYEQGYMNGRDLLEFVPNDRRTDFSLLWGDIFNEGQDRKLGKSGFLKALKKDGTEAYIEFYVTILELSGERVAVCAVSDISERVELQQQLESWNLELQDRVTQATQELSRTNEQLLQRNSELQQFTYAASHDLQSPLRGIGIYAGALKADYGESLDETGIQHLDYIVGETKRLQHLINDLLNYARIDTKSREGFTPVDLNQVIRDVEDQLQPYKDLQFKISYKDLPVVQGIKPLLVQLFYNLIENAIKYRSERPPQITIASHLEGQDYTTVIDVIDNGLGVDPKYAERVFEVFKRLHSQEDIPGTGIGLAICKRIAERHGGSITLSNVEGGTGSIFSVRIANQPYSETSSEQ